MPPSSESCHPILIDPSLEPHIIDSDANQPNNNVWQPNPTGHVFPVWMNNNPGPPVFVNLQYAHWLSDDEDIDAESAEDQLKEDNWNPDSTEHEFPAWMTSNPGPPVFLNLQHENRLSDDEISGDED